MEPTRALGATIVTYDRLAEDREAIAAQIARSDPARRWCRPTITR